MEAVKDVDQSFMKLFTSSTEIDTKFRVSLDAIERKTDPDDVIKGGFVQLFADGTIKHIAFANIDIDVNKPVTDQSLSFVLPNSEIIRELKTDSVRFLLIQGKLDDWYAHIVIGTTSVQVHIGSPSIERCTDMVERLTVGLQVKPNLEKEINYKIFSDQEYPSYAKAKALPWKGISKNYPEATRAQLEKLATYKRDVESSDPRLVIFQGTPGTGKTRFTQALITEWEPWAKFAVIADPEMLFGDGRTSYLVRLIDSAPRDKTLVLVLEDVPDDVVSGTRSGGLGRLLSMGDGLLASSKSIMVLISTNSQMSTLDPALLRPGRTLQKVEFGKFTVSEASERLGEFGPAKSEMSLAEIFVQLGETKSMTTEKVETIGTYL